MAIFRVSDEYNKVSLNYHGVFVLYLRTVSFRNISYYSHSTMQSGNAQDYPTSKTHGSYSVTIFIDFISSRVLSQLFLFWVAYFVIAMIKELDWGTFVSNFVTDMCRTIVGLASFGAAVIYVSHFLRLI